MTETKTNAQIYNLVQEAWNSLEDHQVAQAERILELTAKVEETQGMVRGLARMIRQEVVPLLPRPQRPVPHDGDIFGIE